MIRDLGVQSQGPCLSFTQPLRCKIAPQSIAMYTETDRRPHGQNGGQTSTFTSLCLLPFSHSLSLSLSFPEAHHVFHHGRFIRSVYSFQRKEDLLGEIVSLSTKPSGFKAELELGGREGGRIQRAHTGTGPKNFVRQAQAAMKP